MSIKTPGSDREHEADGQRTQPPQQQPAFGLNGRALSDEATAPKEGAERFEMARRHLETARGVEKERFKQVLLSQAKAIFQLEKNDTPPNKALLSIYRDFENSCRAYQDVFGELLILGQLCAEIKTARFSGVAGIDDPAEQNSLFSALKEKIDKNMSPAMIVDAILGDKEIRSNFENDTNTLFDIIQKAVEADLLTPFEQAILLSHAAIKDGEYLTDKKMCNGLSNSAQRSIRMRNLRDFDKLLTSIQRFTLNEIKILAFPDKSWEALCNVLSEVDKDLSNKIKAGEDYGDINFQTTQIVPASAQPFARATTDELMADLRHLGVKATRDRGAAAAPPPTPERLDIKRPGPADDTVAIEKEATTIIVALQREAGDISEVRRNPILDPRKPISEDIDMAGALEPSDDEPDSSPQRSWVQRHIAACIAAVGVLAASVTLVLNKDIRTSVLAALSGLKPAPAPTAPDNGAAEAPQNPSPVLLADNEDAGASGPPDDEYDAPDAQPETAGDTPVTDSAPEIDASTQPGATDATADADCPEAAPQAPIKLAFQATDDGKRMLLTPSFVQTARGVYSDACEAALDGGADSIWTADHACDEERTNPTYALVQDSTLDRKVDLVQCKGVPSPTELTGRVIIECQSVGRAVRTAADMEASPDDEGPGLFEVTP